MLTTYHYLSFLHKTSIHYHDYEQLLCNCQRNPLNYCLCIRRSRSLPKKPHHRRPTTFIIDCVCFRYLIFVLPRSPFLYHLSPLRKYRKKYGFHAVQETIAAIAVKVCDLIERTNAKRFSTLYCVGYLESEIDGNFIAALEKC